MRALVAAWAFGLCAGSALAERFSHGRFDEVELLRPAGAPTQVVLLLSDADGWNAESAARAQALVGQGALVAGIDLPRLRQRLERDDCIFPDGDFENLSHTLQAYAGVPTYLEPVLAGSGQGAALVYALTAQTRGDGFGGLLTWGFCPALDTRKPLCSGEGTHFRRRLMPGPLGLELIPAERLPVPWFALETTPMACEAAAARGFVGRVAGATWWPRPSGEDQRLAVIYRRLVAANPPKMPPPPAALDDLPLIEVPAAGSGSRFAVLLSGDGGWAAIDKELAAKIAAQGIGVVGFDSLRYFWRARTPQGLADDLDRLIRHYAARWGRREVLLIGYSQGADVLPFAINRLPAASRSMVRYTALLGLAPKASFEFHLSNWLGPSGDHPVAPEAMRLQAGETLCVRGSEERESLCPALAPAHATAVTLPGDHHFGGDYDTLARVILEQSRRR